MALPGRRYAPGRLLGHPGTAQRAPYESYLKSGALRGKRFGVPAFILAGDGVPFHGIPLTIADAAAERVRMGANMLLRPETRAMFLKPSTTPRRGC